MLATAQQTDDTGYIVLQPVAALGLPFVPARVNIAYTQWPLLPELFPVSFPGVKTSRDDVLVDIDRARLVKRMEQYFDHSISHEEMRRLAPSAMKTGAQFAPETTRDTLRKRGFLPDKIVRFLYRPFDVRWLYWEPETNLVDRKREDYFPQVFAGNFWLEARQKQVMEKFDRGYLTTVLADNLGNGLSNFFPLYLQPTPRRGLFDAPPSTADAGAQPNLSDTASAYLARLGATPETLFYHALAVLHAPAYRTENAGALRQDWPRIPLPTTADALALSAALGRRVAALLDTETPVEGVTSGIPDAPLATIGVLARTVGGPFAAEDWRITAGWGRGGNGGVTMPGKGKIMLRDYAATETAALLQAAAHLNCSPDALRNCLGAQTLDIYLNNFAYWRNVPQRVWEYTIGGYQVLKKWLSYREYSLLQRPLAPDEARHFLHTARRIAALLLLENDLDNNYCLVISSERFGSSESKP